MRVTDKELNIFHPDRLKVGKRFSRDKKVLEGQTPGVLIPGVLIPGVLRGPINVSARLKGEDLKGEDLEEDPFSDMKKRNAEKYLIPAIVREETPVKVV